LKVIKAIIIISRGGKFTREKAVDNGVYCVNRLTRGLLIDEICGNDYDKNGFGEKRGNVRLSRLSGRRMNERYGARVRKAEISRGFKKERESAGVERTRVASVNNIRIVAPAGNFLPTSCLTVRASRNSIFIRQSRLVLPFPLALPFLIALC